MAWFLLFLAGLFECGWAIGLKYTDGFTRPLPTALTVISMVVSIVLLGLAVKHLPIGTAYAVWTGIGTVGTVILGIVLMGDSAAPLPPHMVQTWNLLGLDLAGAERDSE